MLLLLLLVVVVVVLFFFKCMNKKRTFINNYNPTISLAEKTNN